jgi:hypothetical protein
MSLTPPPKVRKLQETLHAKAKRAPTYRFYALYDKVYHADVLFHAYQCCAANGGAAGVDGQTFEDIGAYGILRWVDELAEELKKQTYQPAAVRRVYLPKPDGKQRPLGIPMSRAYCISSQGAWGSGCLLTIAGDARSRCVQKATGVPTVGTPAPRLCSSAYRHGLTAASAAPTAAALASAVRR